MPDAGVNELWCRAIAEELQRSGVQRCVLCPGSRNAPLLYALDAQFGAQAISHVDERSAAFIAVGMARQSGAPVAVCVTSGSALANCAPAMVEAQAAGLTLLVIAADRPGELQQCHAPQTMAQAGALNAWIAHAVELVEPVAEDRALRSLRARISRCARVAGPVLINVPLREPLLAARATTWTAPGLSALALQGRGDQQAFSQDCSRSPRSAAVTRGIILAGHGASPAWIERCASVSGFAIIADAISGARARSDAVVHGDALVTGPCAAWRPDIILVIGDVPLSRAVYEWADAQDCEWIAIEPDRRDHDWLARANGIVETIDAWQLLAPRLRGDPAYRQQWLDADARAAAVLQLAMRDEPWGEVLAAHLVCTASAPQQLIVANSMAVRHANLHLGRRHRARIHANRGVNGIDGTLATAIGVAHAATASPTWLLVGDVAFAHDLSALAALPQTPGSGAIIVLDNGGGGVFDFLPVSAHPAFHQRVRTPTAIDPVAVAAAFGLAAQRCADRATLSAALAATDAPGWRLLHIVVPAGETVARHRALLTALANA